jgi:ribosome-binding protein aMBF1 (putative translation factor)
VRLYLLTLDVCLMYQDMGMESTRFLAGTEKMLTREQLRMARAALNWSVRDLAAKAGVAANTVSRYENGSDAYGETLLKLQRTLETAGLIFLDENGDGPGVRFKKKRPRHP